MKKPTVLVLDAAMRELIGKSWRVLTSQSLSIDGWEFRLRPAEYAVVTLGADEWDTLTDRPSALLDRIDKRLKRAQDSIVDRLDASIGRLPRTESPAPTGECCNFCGAPHWSKP